MFSISRRPKASATCNKRVAAFWAWFQSVAPRFYATIEAGKCAELAGETSAKVAELLPGFQWVFA